MPGIVEFQNIFLQDDGTFTPTKVNRAWGSEYMLMDSKTFLNSTDGTEYLPVIEMLQKIWEMNNAPLFSGL